MMVADPMLKDAFVSLFAAAIRSARKQEVRFSVTAEPRDEAKRAMW
jgi:hypothetical protein